MATIYAANLTTTAVQAAINSASNDDTVILPAGTAATWTGQVTIPTIRLTIMGAGIGQTIIPWTGPHTGVFSFTGSVDNYWRLSGLTLTTDYAASSSTINCSRPCTSFRVDNVRLERTGGAGNYLTGINLSGPARSEIWGVIDHCQLYEYHIAIQHYNAGIGCDADSTYPNPTSWARPINWAGGGTDALFIEDCTCEGVYGGSNMTQICDGISGCRMVIRHNHFINGSISCHGPCSGIYGALRTDVYDNTFHSTVGCSRCIFLRGGTGNIHDNTWTTVTPPGYNQRLAFDYQRSCVYTQWCATSPSRVTHCRCGATLDGLGNPNTLDTGPYATTYGYPCHCQIGRGANQSTDPFYIWNNYYGATPVTPELVNACSSDPQQSFYIQAGRDYILEERPGYAEDPYPHPLVVATLAQGHRYYWRARYRDADSATSAWSRSGTTYFQLGATATAAINLGQMEIDANVTRRIDCYGAIMLGRLFVDGDSRAGIKCDAAFSLGQLNIDAEAERKIMAAGATNLAQLEIDASGVRKITVAASSYLGNLTVNCNAALNNAAPLQIPGAKYYWRARYRDADGNVSAWSTGADYFITGDIRSEITLRQLQINAIVEREVKGIAASNLGQLEIDSNIAHEIAGSAATNLGQLELDGVAEREVKTTTAAILLGRLKVAGNATRAHTARGAITLAQIAIGGTSAKGWTAVGAITLGALTIATKTAHTARGAITLGGAQILGLVRGCSAVIPVTTRIQKQYTVTTRIVKRFTTTTLLEGESAT